MGSRFRFLSVLAAISLAAATACSSGGSESSDTAPEESVVGEVAFDSVTLRVGEVKNGEFQWAAETAPSFSETPYEIEFVYFDSSPDMLAALDAGAIDIAPAVQAPSLVSAQGNADPAWTADDAPLRIVAAWSNPQSPGWVVLSNDPTVNDVADLSGKKLAYTRGAFGQVYWLNLMEKNSLTRVEAVQLPYLDGLAAFQDGAVDALITSYRFGAAVQARGAGTIIDTSSGTVEYASLTVARSDALASPEKEAAIRDFLERTRTAYEWAAENPEIAESFFVTTMSLSEEAAKIVVPSELKTVLPLGEVLETLLGQVVDALVEGGVIPNTVDPTIPFDRRFG